MEHEHNKYCEFQNEFNLISPKFINGKMNQNLLRKENLMLSLRSLLVLTFSHLVYNNDLKFFPLLDSLSGNP